MRPGIDYNNRVVFEGDLEVRVAAQILTNAGQGGLISAFTPEIEQPYISKGEFQRSVLAERQRRRAGDTGADYTVQGEEAAQVMMALSEEILPPPPPDVKTKNMKNWLGQRFGEWMLTAINQASTEELVAAAGEMTLGLLVEFHRAVMQSIRPED